MVRDHPSWSVGGSRDNAVRNCFDSADELIDVISP
jgi:hypothetical protein